MGFFFPFLNRWDGPHRTDVTQAQCFRWLNDREETAAITNMHVHIQLARWLKLKPSLCFLGLPFIQAIAARVIDRPPGSCDTSERGTVETGQRSISQGVT